jgi:hypothetical protein
LIAWARSLWCGGCRRCGGCWWSSAFPFTVRCLSKEICYCLHCVLVGSGGGGVIETSGSCDVFLLFGCVCFCVLFCDYLV